MTRYTPVVDAARMIEDNLARGKTKPLPLGHYIREHLRLKGADYQHSIYACYMTACKRHEYAGCTPESFRRYFSTLRALELVVPVKPGQKPFEKSYYALNPKTEGSLLWNDPQTARTDQRRDRRGP